MEVRLPAGNGVLGERVVDAESCERLCQAFAVAGDADRCSRPNAGHRLGRGEGLGAGCCRGGGAHLTCHSFEGSRR